MAFRAWGQWLSRQLGPEVSFRDPLSNDHTVHGSDIFDSQSACPLCWRCNLGMVLSKPVTSFEEIVVRPFTRVWSKCRGIAPALAPGYPCLVDPLCCTFPTIAIICGDSCCQWLSNDSEMNKHAREENDTVT